mgnify:CR=1 FL=1
MNDEPTSWWRKHPLPLMVFIAVAGYFLWAEHRAHVIELLPWLLVLGCVGMHLFMHGGHGHHDGQSNPGSNADKEE